VSGLDFGNCVVSTAEGHTHVNVTVALGHIHLIGLDSLVEGAACLWSA
jgi:hypothetical protein